MATLARQRRAPSNGVDMPARSDVSTASAVALELLTHKTTYPPEAEG